jgi:hypothetical protein
MKELTHYLFTPPGNVEALCIPTNGHYTKSRGAIMGKGVALAAATRWPLIKFELARKLEKGGNRVHVLLEPYDKLYNLPYYVLSFPTKDHWQEASKLSLIQRSALDLLKMTNLCGWQQVWLPRPGCGAGGCKWSTIKPLLEVLDDRFTVVHLEEWNEVLQRVQTETIY